MDSKYLPSKSFIKKAGILLVLVIIVLLITKVTPSIRAKISSEKNSKILVKDVIENDSNNNGILDWEEKLWGLDPKGDGSSNKEYIFAKKKSISGTSKVVESITQNDKLSREFFSVIMSLQDSGMSTEDALAKISNEIGQKVELVQIPNTYKISNLITVPPTKTSINTYKNGLTRILADYKNRGVGSEMGLLALALDHDNKNLLTGLDAIQISYFEMIKELSDLKIPNEIVTTHIIFLNNLEGSAVAMTNINKVFDDSIDGLSGVATYKKDSDDAATALTDISNYIENGIIKQ